MFFQIEIQPLPPPQFIPKKVYDNKNPDYLPDLKERVRKLGEALPQKFFADGGGTTLLARIIKIRERMIKTILVSPQNEGQYKMDALRNIHDFSDLHKIYKACGGDLEKEGTIRCIVGVLDPKDKQES